MNVLLIAITLGVVTGLRSLTAPAAVAWAAHLGWLNLHGSPLNFMGSKWAVILFTLGALFELVNDKLPKTPPRTAPPGFIVRIVMSALCGACVYVSAGQSLAMGAVLGVIGAVIGTLGGYQARKRLVAAFKIKDIFVAIPEDLIAILLALFLVR